MTQFILFLKGIAMGAANVIPGVSGGTVAFITGIYERLINALKSIDLTAIKLFFTGQFKAFAKKVDLNFLAILFLGVIISIFSLAKILVVALDQYEVLTLSFFFGLIIASVWAVSKQIEKRSSSVVLSFILGAGLAVLLAFLPPAQSNDSFFYLIICGVAAVCSMILPGLSGSYVLLLMGNYALVLRAISSFNIGVMIPIGIGCILGLVTLSRLLSYLFRKYKNITISTLAGFVAGSLLIIWPWKVEITQLIEGKEKAVAYEWEWPDIDEQFFIALLLMVFGYFLVFLMERLATNR